MAFVCTVSQGGFQVQVFQAGLSDVAIISTGHDGLDVLPAGCPNYIFYIIEAEIRK